MDALACKSASTCPPCYHFVQGRCTLAATVMDALHPALRAPPTATMPLLAVA
jgi:hypothetical protein